VLLSVEIAKFTQLQRHVMMAIVIVLMGVQMNVRSKTASSVAPFHNPLLATLTTT
jgi:hypothetical protein